MAALDDAKGLAQEDIIVQRIRKGQFFVERGIANRDKIACKRFLDGSEAGVDIQHDDYYVDMAGVLPNSQEVGNVNYLAVNVLTKVASVAIGDPDFHVECQDDQDSPAGLIPTPTLPVSFSDVSSSSPVNPQIMQQPDPMTLLMQQQLGPMLGANAPVQPQGPTKAELVRQFLKHLWKRRQWGRVTRTALLKRSLSGMGIVAYLWHAERGPILEHVRVADFAVDPNVVDWRNLRWAARKIKLPKEEAVKAFPGVEFDSIRPDIPNMDYTAALPSETIEVWVYWDKDVECVVYGSQVLQKTPNLYGKVPLVFLQGDIAPESEFSLGDYDIATGLQVQLARLQGIINNMAENGGAILWYNPGLLDDASKEAFANGRPEGAVGISAPAEDVFGYVTAEPVGEGLLEAFKLSQQGLDSVTGVSEYQRGVINQSVKFATEAAMLANQSGARGNQARIEYEQFMDEIARALLDVVIRFGASMLDTANPQEIALWDALQSVTDICVIESSTTYKDPASEQQTSLQLIQAMMPFVQAGLVNPLPLIMDTFRAYGKRDVAKYINQQPMMPMMQPGQMPPGGQPAPAPGGMPGQSSPPAPVLPSPAGLV